MAGVTSDEAIQQFLALTNSSTSEARQYLEASHGDVEEAVDAYFTQSADMEEEAEDDEPNSSTPLALTSTGTTGGGRTLAGGPAPAQSTSSRNPQPNASRQPPRRSGPVTIGDLSSGGHGHAHDDDDDDDEQPGQNMFVGGDKSGLAVQNPNSAQDIMNRLLQRAQENAARPGGDDDEVEQPGQRAFGGRGVTLGGDDAPSTVIEDPRAQRPRAPPRVSRTLHVWRNGFSIDDGPLRDPQADPDNARSLQMILHGQAPMHILNVEPGQEVDVNLVNRRDEMYVQPKAAYKPFSGSGQRLGEEGPASATTTPASSTQAKPASTTTAASSAAAAPSVDVDSSQPTITLQLRLGDGTRLQSRFNTTHTIGDVYGFVNASSPASNQRAYVLSSTFPPKDFEDKAAVLGDLPEFKRGGVMVQKWK